MVYVWLGHRWGRIRTPRMNDGMATLKARFGSIEFELVQLFRERCRRRWWLHQ